MPERFGRGALTEATCLILFSLWEPRHGYGVMQHIAAITNGRVNLGAGTLYGALNLLLEKGWIETVSGIPNEKNAANMANPADPMNATSPTNRVERRKLYRITPAGKHAVEAEMARLSELLAIGSEMMEKEKNDYIS